MSKSNAVRLGSDSLAAARSHSGSDSHPRLSFIALVPLRYATGASFTTEPVRIPFAKRKRGIRILASRRRSVRLGSDVPKGTSFTTEPVRIPIAKQKSTHWVLFCFGGKIGIRTLVGVLAQTRFPVVRLRPAQPSLHSSGRAPLTHRRLCHYSILFYGNQVFF